MKNHDNAALLAHKRRIDAQRKDAAIKRAIDAVNAQRAANAKAMHKVSKAK